MPAFAQTAPTPTAMQLATLKPLGSITGGATLQGVAFDETETGFASSLLVNGVTEVYAEFANLPDIDTATQFYEGWVVDTSGASPVVESTGELIDL